MFKTLLLSGGAMQGFYTLGYLQKAYEQNILTNIDVYIGVSSGAIICYLFLIGYTPVEIILFVVKYAGLNSTFEKFKDFDFIKMMKGEGAISFDETVGKILHKMSMDKIGYIPTFIDIKEKQNKKLILSVYNLTKMSNEYISYENYPNLTCLEAIAMSCSVPFFFKEIIYDSNRYIDGGISDNLPLKIAEKEGLKTLAISINPDSMTQPCFIYENPIKYFCCLCLIPVLQITKNKVPDSANITFIKINPDPSDISFSMDSNIKILDMFSIGYKQCDVTLY